jgi:putative ABC transport system permease protein
VRTFGLAARNLLRNRRRSLATLLAMVVGLVSVLIFGGYRSNISYGMQTGFIQGGGHLQIQHVGFFLEGGDNPTTYGIDAYERIIEAVRSDPVLAPLVNVVTPTLQLGGIAGNFTAGVSRSVMAIGLVAKDRNRMLEWNEFGTHSYARPLPLAGTASDSVVIGTGVARKLLLCEVLHVPGCGLSGRASAPGQPSEAPAFAPPGASAGRPGAKEGAEPADLLALSRLEGAGAAPAPANRIELLAASARGAPNVASLSVIEARNVGIKAMDDVYLAMHLAQAQRLVYGAGSPQVTAIQVQLHHTADLPAVRARLAQLLAGRFPGAPLEILDFETLNPMYKQSIQFMDSMFGFIAVLIGVIVLFTIGNTMGTAVLERTVEIGTLRAMGLRRSGIRRIFLAEALLLGFAGSVAGVLCALAIASAINHSGMTWVPPGYSYAYLILVRVWEDPALVAASAAGMTLVTLASAWWPAGRAARMAVVDALRHA